MKRINFFFSIAFMALLAISACKSSSGGQGGDSEETGGSTNSDTNGDNGNGSVTINTGNTGGSGKVETDPELGESLTFLYREDAARLTLRDELTRTRAADADGFLPEAAVDQYFNDLKAIRTYALKNEEVPSVLGEIHTFANPSLQSILVVLEKDAPFDENWKKKEIKTGNNALDALTSKYQLSIANYRGGSLGPTVTLESALFVNTTHISKELTEITGVRFAEPEASMGDGNNIEAAAGGKSGRGIKFSEGWGDCPSGCIKRRYYTFTINMDGSVFYVGATGDERE